MRGFLGFLVLVLALVRAIASCLLGVEEALATERGRSRKEHLRGAFARIYDRDTGGLIRVAKLVQASLEFQITLLFVGITRVVADVMEVAALGHLGQWKVFLTYLGIFTMY